MEKISGISSTSRSNNNSRKTSYYGSKKARETIVDSLEYKRLLDIAMEAKKAVKDVNKFKSIIEKAEERLTTKLEVAPLKEDIYKSESARMMANGGIGIKARVETKPIEELSRPKPAKRVVNVYTTSYEQYKRDLKDTDVLYKIYEDRRKTFNEFEDNTSLIEQTEKVSFWSKFKSAIKNFFKGKEQENTTIASAQPNQPKVDKAAQYRKSVPKAAPQISKEEVERKRLQNIRELAIKSR